MQNVTVVDHPLVQHKLTLIREKELSTKSFRDLCRELGILLCYGVMAPIATSIELQAQSETRFWDPRGAYIDFQLDGQGKVSGLFLEQGPQRSWMGRK